MSISEATNYVAHSPLHHPVLRLLPGGKEFAARQGLDYEEIDVGFDPDKRADGLPTVPQIFIHGRHVGGYDELAALEREGKLNDWLANMLETSALGELADASEP